LGCWKPTAPQVHIGCGWNTGETDTTPADSTRGTSLIVGGEAGTAEAAAGGVVGVTCGMDVKIRIIGVTHGAEVKARVVGVTCGTGFRAIGIKVVVRPPVSTTWAVGALGGRIRPSSFATQVV
jgi:hypothetical protein